MKSKKLNKNIDIFIRQIQGNDLKICNLNYEVLILKLVINKKEDLKFKIWCLVPLTISIFFLFKGQYIIVVLSFIMFLLLLYIYKKSNKHEKKALLEFDFKSGKIRFNNHNYNYIPQQIKFEEIKKFTIKHDQTSIIINNSSSSSYSFDLICHTFINEQINLFRFTYEDEKSSINNGRKTLLFLQKTVT